MSDTAQATEFYDVGLFTHEWLLERDYAFEF